MLLEKRKNSDALFQIMWNWTFENCKLSILLPPENLIYGEILL